MLTSLMVCRSDGLEISGGFGEHDAIDAFREEQFYRAIFFFEIVVAVAEQQVIAEFLRGVFRAANDHREKWIRNVGHDHADGLRFLFDEAARDQIRAVVQFANRSFDALAQNFADVGFVVDDGGYGKNRNAGFARYVGDACGLGSFPRSGFSRRWHARKANNSRDIASWSKLQWISNVQLSGLGSITSRTIAFKSAHAAMNCRSVRRVGP